MNEARVPRAGAGEGNKLGLCCSHVTLPHLTLPHPGTSHPVTLSFHVTLSHPVTVTSHVTLSQLILSPSSRHLVISSCHPVTYVTCHILSPCHISCPCHPHILSPCHSLSPCHISCYPITSHPITLSHLVTLSHPVTLSPQVVVTSHPVTSSHLVMSPCHISCQISSCHTSCHPSHLIMSPRHICSVCRSLPGDAAPPTGEASPCRAPASSLIRGPRLSGVGRGEVEPIHSLTPT